MFFRKNKKYKIGVVLGGGGARGFAHLGILQALKERGIVPEIISGVSAGAIAGCFIASGREPRDAFEIIKHYRFFDLTSLGFPRTGLFKLINIKEAIENEIGYRNIEDLPVPLVIAAINLLDGRIEYFSEGSLSTLVQASASIPILYSPVQINQKLYADGGVVDNLPLKPLSKICKKTIVSNVSPVNEISELKNIAQVASRMFQLTINAGRREKMQICDLFIEPPQLRNYDLMDTRHAKEIFDVGYEYVKSMNIRI